MTTAQSQRSGGVSHQRAAIDRALASLSPGTAVRPVVESSNVQRTLAAFEAADSLAQGAQSRYRAWGRRGLRATTFGILVGAIILFPLDHLTSGWVRAVIGALQTLGLLVTFGAMLVMLRWKPQVQWMAERARAEELRGRIFHEILSASDVSGGAPQGLAADKLDLLLGAYIEDQLAFFDRRAGDHKGASSKRSLLHLVGYGFILAALLVGSVGLLRAAGFTATEHLVDWLDFLGFHDASRWQLGLATMASGLLAHATARSLMDEDERKAALYAATAKKLRRLVSRDETAARIAAQAGNEVPLRKLFEDARQILAQEHAVWSFGREADEQEGTSAL